jgi:hypothetical protein
VDDTVEQGTTVEQVEQGTTVEQDTVTEDTVEEDTGEDHNGRRGHSSRAGHNSRGRGSVAADTTDEDIAESRSCFDQLLTSLHRSCFCTVMFLTGLYGSCLGPAVAGPAFTGHVWDRPCLGPVVRACF